MLNITAKIVRMNSRECRNEDWEATIEVDFFELVKQLEQQGYLCDFKLNGISYNPSKNFEAI